MAGLFGAGTKAPQKAPVALMPDTESATVQNAKRRKVAETVNRSGRQSTILSDDKLGG